MTRAELIRKRAEDCLTRARNLNDRAQVEQAPKAALDLARASNAQCIAGLVLLELAGVEREVDAA